MPAKPKQPKDPVEAAHEEWFFNLEPKYVVQLMKEWNETRLEIKIKKKKDYDAYFNYFRTMPASHTNLLLHTGRDILTTEAYSALSRWGDIITNPSRMDKIHRAAMSSKGKKKQGKTIIELALENDRLGVLKATRDSIAEKLEKGATPRDTAALAREMTEVMTQIADYEKRLGPAKETVLGQLLDDMPDVGKKRNKDSGARNTSFKSRVTIEDVE